MSCIKIVGIAGGSGSGKTFLTDKIKKTLNDSNVLIIAQENYYKDLGNISFKEREKQNFDHPDAIDFALLISHLKKLKSGSKIDMPVYDYKTHTRTGEFFTIYPKKICRTI